MMQDKAQKEVLKLAKKETKAIKEKLLEEILNHTQRDAQQKFMMNMMKKIQKWSSILTETVIMFQQESK